jgi:hypothetical protein
MSTLTPLYVNDKQQKSEFASMQMVVKVGLATPFPVKDKADTSKVVYKVIVGAGDGNAEILNVTSCTPVVNGEQVMTVSKVTGSGAKEKFKKPKFNHVMSGVLAGAFNPSSTHVFVQPGEFDYCGISLVSKPDPLGSGKVVTEQVSTKKMVGLKEVVDKYPTCGTTERPQESCTGLNA